MIEEMPEDMSEEMSEDMLYFGAKSLIHFDLHQRVTTGLCCGASGLLMLGGCWLRYLC